MTDIYQGGGGPLEFPQPDRVDETFIGDRRGAIGQGIPDPIRVTHPDTQTMEISAGATERISTRTRMEMERFFLDVPSDVELKVFSDGSQIFFSPGGESIEEEYRDARETINSKITSEFNHTNSGGSSEQVRMTAIGAPPEFVARQIA